MATRLLSQPTDLIISAEGVAAVTDPAAKLIDLQVQLSELRTQLVHDKDAGLLDIDLFEHAERTIIEISVWADQLVDGSDPTLETLDDQDLEALLSEDG